MTNTRYKLGKQPARQDSRTLQFKSYLTKLPPIPASIDWSAKVPNWEMLGNDTVGDCTCAGAGHLEMLWSSQASIEEVPTTDQILSAYSSITGYNPSDPNTDNGACLIDVLNYWRQNPIAGHNIQCYAQVELKNISQVHAAIAIFGGVYIGVMLPSNAMDAFDRKAAWTDTTCNDIEGGHCIILSGYTPTTLTAITWGDKQVMSNEWFERYADEVYAIISPQWLEANGCTPNGFNLAQLEIDLKLV